MIKTEDLHIYIDQRLSDIKEEQKNIKNYKLEEREFVNRQLKGRKLEIKRLKNFIYNL